MLDNFGKNLLNELRKINMTQLELSKKTGISNSNISKWIKNKTIPSVRSIEKIAKTLNIPIYLLTKENETQKNFDNSNNLEIIGNNNSNINQTNNNRNIDILLHKIQILEKEIEIIKLKLNNK